MARHHHEDYCCLALENISPLTVALRVVRLDGGHVVKNGVNMKSLTVAQEHQLIEIITKEFGTGMEQADFADALLGLLEDIPGFETAQQSTINRFINKLWGQYHHD